MTRRTTSPLFLALVAALPLVTAQAQAPYSPASPPITSSPFGGLSLPRTAPATQQQPTQPRTMQSLTGLSAVSGGFVANPQVMTSEPIDPNHKLGRGDRLSYQVLEDREPEKVYPLIVTDSGDVNVPLAGLIKAAGKTPQDLSRDIKSRLEREWYFHATVSLGLDAVAQRTSRGRVWVTGAVRQVGAIELPVDAPLTASQAITQAGGPVDFSNLKRVVVLRPGGPPKGIEVNVKDVQRGALDKDVVLQPGDTVNVPPAGIGFRM